MSKCDRSSAMMSARARSEHATLLCSSLIFFVVLAVPMQSAVTGLHAGKANRNSQQSSERSKRHKVEHCNMKTYYQIAKFSNRQQSHQPHSHCNPAPSGVPSPSTPPWTPATGCTPSVLSISASVSSHWIGETRFRLWDVEIRFDHFVVLLLNVDLQRELAVVHKGPQVQKENGSGATAKRVWMSAFRKHC